MTVNVRRLPTHLHVTVTGDYSDEEAKSWMARLMSVVHEQDSPCILADCLDLKGSLSMRQRFEMVAFILQLRINSLLHGQPARYRTALVARPPLVHPRLYLLRLLIERNVRINICSTVEEALSWLGIDALPPDIPGSPNNRMSQAASPLSE